MILKDQYLQEPSVIETELYILFNKKKALTIFDIGACDGLDSIRYSRMFTNAEIFMFEPLQENIQLIEDNLSRYKIKNVSVNELALSDEAGFSTFYKSAGNPYANYDCKWNKSSSLLEPNKEILKKIHSWLEFNETIEVKTETLDNFCALNRISNIDFIHMDVQGAEMMVLKGAEKILQNTKVIWLEVGNVELYKKQSLKNEIIHFLREKGFSLIKDTSGNWPEGDCLFARLSLLQLLKLKIEYYLWHLLTKIKSRL